MPKFYDKFTGITFEMGFEWLQVVQKDVAKRIRPKLKDTLRESANGVAEFWRDEYYESLFPLCFGLTKDSDGLYQHDDLFPDSEVINLEAQAGKELRRKFLDQDRLPPLLPAVEEGETDELMADRVLTQAALANLLLRQRGVSEENLHIVRLACLTYPLFQFLETLLLQGEQGEAVTACCRFLKGETTDLPSGIDLVLMKLIRDLKGAKDMSLWMVLIAVQRIKRYVFETPGLNEIRGASTLLDDLTEAGKREVSQELGPEVVLRAVGATLLFLAPTEAIALAWKECLQEAFYRATGTAFAAATMVQVPVQQLLEDYKSAVEKAFRTLGEDRARAEQPLFEALPFEARCHLCRIRPAKGWARMPGEAEPMPLCSACYKKRDVGQPGRTEKAHLMLEWLGLHDPEALGVAGKQPGDYVAQSLGIDDSEEKGFVPQGTRRPLIATIYGDGNNFGAVSQNLPSIAAGLQWTQRVEKVTRAAAALALARATQETARERGWKPGEEAKLLRLPFQVLALGGDDLSLFAWAPVGLLFARDFLTMMNIEFQQGPGEKIVEQPIAFSLGMLLTDRKASVRRTVEVAEGELLKWAKRAFRESDLSEGNLAWLVANSQEQIPDDLETYRRRMFLKEGGLIDLCLTLRPLTADELRWLLKKTRELLADSGRLHRLTAPFVQSRPMVALLHYVYQRGRSAKRRGDDWLKKLEEGKMPDSLQKLQYPAFPRSRLESFRMPFGILSEGKNPLWFTPLWDLLELVKILE